VCIYARNLLAMDMCGLDNDTARHLAGDKVCFFALCHSEYFFIFIVYCRKVVSCELAGCGKLNISTSQYVKRDC